MRLKMSVTPTDILNNVKGKPQTRRDLRCINRHRKNRERTP